MTYRKNFRHSVIPRSALFAFTLFLPFLALVGTARSQTNPADAKSVAQSDQSLSTPVRCIDGTVYRHLYPAPENPQSDELVYAADWQIWIPDRVQTLRGIIVHQHGCGAGSGTPGKDAVFDLQWQALARKWDCALMAVSYNQTGACDLWCNPTKGSAKRFIQAISDFAAQTSHPELTIVPWAIWGHSGGGQWTSSMVQVYPERIIGAWARSGHPNCVSQSYDELPFSDAVKDVPIMINLGIQEKTEPNKLLNHIWNATFPYFQSMRQRGAKIGFLIDPKTSHQTGDSRYPAICFLDICLSKRLPDKPGTAELKKIESGVTLPADQIDRASEQELADFVGDGLWLPSQEYIDVWKKYTADCTFDDSTPPPPPANVQINRTTGELTWTSTADVESGLKEFVVLADGQEIARIQGEKNPFGRSVFQGLRYSDTPVLTANTESAMRFANPLFADRPNAIYAVQSVNTNNLTSAPVEAR